MHSTLNPKPTDLIVRYFEQIALEDEQMARTPADDAARHPPAANNIQVPGDRPWFGRSAGRGFVGLLLAACIGVAAVAWQSYGDAAKPNREMGAAVRPVFMAAAGKPGAPRATEPTCRSGVRGDGSTSATGTSGAARSGRRCADRSCPISRIGAVAPVDGARSRNRGARDRTAQGQHRAAQDQPGTNDPRQCEGRRAVQGEPRTNGARYCQRFRAEPAAQDISASAAADCHPDAQAGAG